MTHLCTKLLSTPNSS